MIRLNCLLAGLVMTMAPTVAAELPSNITGTPPGPAGKPTVISVSALILDVSQVNGADQSFTADFFLMLSWHDPRLAGAFETAQRFPLDTVWHPRV